MKYHNLILSTAIFFIGGCFSDKTPKETTPKKEPKKVIERSEEQTTKTPPKAFNGIQLNENQKPLFNALKRYLNHLKSFDTEGIISMTYPKFFNAIPQRSFRNQIFTMTNSSKIDIVDFSTKITTIGEINSFSKGSFAEVGYNSTIQVYLKESRLYNTESSINTLYSILVRKYGRDKIHVDTQTRVVTIKKSEKMLGIKENGKWKFIGDNPTYREYYPTFLPYDILEMI